MYKIWILCTFSWRR